MTEPTTEAGGRPFFSLDLPEAEVDFYPAFFPQAEADRLLDQLVETTEWRQDSMKMFGQLKLLPGAWGVTEQKIQLGLTAIGGKGP